MENYRYPDPVYDREQELLRVLIRLGLAEEAIRQERYVYAAELLKQVPVETAYLSQELNRRRLLLLGNIQKVAAQLPSLDNELLLRAEEALEEGKLSRAVHLLEAMEQQTDPKWHLLRGETYLLQKKWNEAAAHLLKAEAAFPRLVYPRLETCYRELENFQKAYVYACRQRSSGIGNASGRILYKDTKI